MKNSTGGCNATIVLSVATAAVLEETVSLSLLCACSEQILIKIDCSSVFKTLKDRPDLNGFNIDFSN